MRPAYLALVLLVWMASRCSHTETVARQAEPSAAAGAQEGGPAATAEPGEGKTTASADKPTAKARRERDPADAKPRERNDDDASEAEPPPLATSAAGLLQPRAAQALQDKLIARGYLDKTARSGKLDGKTKRALREFQREQGLPATGTPDDLTVEKLGLSPDDLFRSAGDVKP
jgi:peptidoglycan hydrolase-like protein with peptidoglycan-binding domain